MEISISNEEAFHTEYRVFLSTVEILSEPANKQCEIMGSYNVAWELKDDITAGMYLLENPASLLTQSQESAIEQLVGELNKIPESVLVAATTEEANLAAMMDPSWVPIRKLAAALIDSLDSATKKNEEYFG